MEEKQTKKRGRRKKKRKERTIIVGKKRKKERLENEWKNKNVNQIWTEQNKLQKKKKEIRKALALE